MSDSTPRMRMFAGPNGSGKSVLKTHLSDKLLGVYLNPDEIELSIRQTGGLDFSVFGLQITAEELFSFLKVSQQLRKYGNAELARDLLFKDNRLDFGAVPVNSYFAATLTDFLREKFLDANETVVKARLSKREFEGGGSGG